MTFYAAILLAAQSTGDPYGASAEGRAHKQWLNCAYEQVRQLAPQPETARDVATAALSRCSREELQYEFALLKKFVADDGVRGFDKARQLTREMRARLADDLVSVTMSHREDARMINCINSAEGEIDKALACIERIHGSTITR